MQESVIYCAACKQLREADTVAILAEVTLCNECLRLALTTLPATPSVELELSSLADTAQYASNEAYDNATTVFITLDRLRGSATEVDAIAATIDDRLMGAFNHFTNAARSLQAARADLLRYLANRS